MTGSTAAGCGRAAAGAPPRAPARGSGWRTVVTARPAASLLVTVALLGALAVPVLSMRTGEPGVTGPARQQRRSASPTQAIDRAFPGAPADAELVVTGHDLGRPAAAARHAGPRARGPSA